MSKVIRMRGLPFMASQEDIRSFFFGRSYTTLLPSFELLTYKWRWLVSIFHAIKHADVLRQTGSIGWFYSI